MRHLFLLLLVLLAACDPYYGYQYSGYPRPGYAPPGYAPGYQPGYYGAPPAYPGQQPYYGAQQPYYGGAPPAYGAPGGYENCGTPDRPKPCSR
jgi:hypothetical protein